MKKNNLIVILLFLLFLSTNYLIAQYEFEDETINRFEFGINLGSIHPKDSKTFFGTESAFYPEVEIYKTWTKEIGELRAGLSTGIMYVHFIDDEILIPEKPESVEKTVIIIPSIFEFNFLYFEKKQEIGPKFFWQFGGGLGFFLSGTKVYETANLTSFKVGAGMMTEGLYFEFNLKRIWGKAGVRESFTYDINRQAGRSNIELINIGPETILDSDVITVGFGTRF